VRCVQTFEPLAQALDLAIETTDFLAEGVDGGRALDFLLSLSGIESIAACTHADVLTDVVRVVAGSAVELDGPFEVPVASRWVLDVADGRVVGGTFVERPPTD
jgi:broad specificity phosphatase PhoE